MLVVGSNVVKLHLVVAHPLRVGLTTLAACGLAEMANRIAQE